MGVRCGDGGYVAPAAKSLVTDPNTGRQLSCRSLCLIFGREKGVREGRDTETDRERD